MALLAKYGASQDLDVLSIEADYDGFYIMHEILQAGYAPHILVVEFKANFGHEWSVITVGKPVRKEAETRWRKTCYFGA